jgi:hypothetical protein
LSDVGAALNGQGPFTDKAYLSRDSNYIRYDWLQDQTDTGYPLNLSAWKLQLPYSNGLDAALNGFFAYAGEAYFFNGGRYVRYDCADDKIDPGYPLPLSAWNLPNDFCTGIDAAVNAPANYGGGGKYYGKAWFFKGGEYVRYDWGSNSVDFRAPLSRWGLQFLAWGKKVNPGFKSKEIKIAGDLGCDPNYLMASMAFETGETFSPSVRNPQSGATGLIQFMPNTAKRLGTTTDALAAMSAVEQLDYVEKYFEGFRGMLHTLPDVYMAILCPAAVGKAESFVCYSAPSKAKPPRWSREVGKGHEPGLFRINRLLSPLSARMAGETRFRVT